MRVLTVLLSLALLAGCSGIRVDQDYDTSVDFSPLKTWQWQGNSSAGNSHPLANNDLVDQRVADSVSTTLSAKGFTLTDNNPQLLVSYQLVYEAPVPVPQEPRVGVGMGASSGGSSYGGISIRLGDSTPPGHEILIIDIKNPAGKLLWRGSAKQTRKGSDSPQEASERMAETVNAILAGFPPGK